MALFTCRQSPRPRRRGLRLPALLAPLFVLIPLSARADPSPEPAQPAAPPPPYSLPWQLRPAVAATVVRSDTVLALYKDPATGKGGSTVASTLLFSYKVTPEFAPLIRLALLDNSPAAGKGSTTLANPAFGFTYAAKLSASIRMAAFLGLTLPVGGGGGNDADPVDAATARSGVLARSAMDNALFAVNDLTVFPGVDIAYVANNLTVQVEATLLQLTRARGERVQKDGARTNFTAGLHVGYFVLPMLSLGAEIRHQRWLSTPAAVAADKTGALRDTSTFALGVRYHQKIGQSMWLRPGVAYARGIDNPMADQGYNNIQLDIPFAF